MGAPEFTLRGHIWLECERGLEIGPGRAALLEQIHDLGSIRKAADALGLTYRQAWARVKAMNTSADCQLVQRTSGGVNGGGASLTKQGQSILEAFQQQDQRFQNYLLEEIATRKNDE